MDDAVDAILRQQDSEWFRMLAIGGGMSRRNAAEIWRREEESGVLRTMMDNLADKLGSGEGKTSSKIAALRGIAESKSERRKEREQAIERKKVTEKMEREEKERERGKAKRPHDGLSHLRTTSGASWSLVSILAKLRIHGPEDLFREMDFNGDGLISTDELYKWISRRAGVDLWEILR